MISLLTALHIAHVHRLRYVDHTLANDATFQRQLASSHGPALNAAHLALRMAAPILRSRDRAGLVNIRFVDAFMRTHYDGALLPPFVRDWTQPQGKEEDEKEEEEKEEEDEEEAGGLREQQGVGTGQQQGGVRGGGDNDDDDDVESLVQPEKQTFASKLVAVCLSSLFISLPAAYHTYRNTRTVLEMRMQVRVWVWLLAGLVQRSRSGERKRKRATHTHTDRHRGSFKHSVKHACCCAGAGGAHDADRTRCIARTPRPPQPRVAAADAGGRIAGVTRIGVCARTGALLQQRCTGTRRRRCEVGMWMAACGGGRATHT